MIAIQVVLIIGFVYLLARFLASPRSNQIRAWKKILGCLFVVLAVVVILFPNISNDIAHWVGVGRGADLLLYLLTLSFVLHVLNLYITSKDDQRRIVELSRKVALIEANNKYRGKRKDS